MRKKSFAMILLKGLFYLIVLFLLSMLFWSSELIQEDLKKIQEDIDQIEEKINRQEKQGLPQPKAIKEISLPYKESENILKDDPFMKGPIQRLLGPYFVPSGVFERATYGREEHLHPFSNWAQVDTWHGMCTPTVGKSIMGRYEPFGKNAAIAMVETESPGEVSYTVYLRDDLFWEPLKKKFFPSNFELSPHFLKRHKVTAEDFKFYVDAIKNEHVSLPGAIAMRSYLKDLKDIEVIDDTTFIAKWNAKEINGKWQARYEAKYTMASLRPLASFLYKYYRDGTKIIEDDKDPNTYREHPAFGEQFSEHWGKQIIASIGPWIFDGFNETDIRFRRNRHFFDPYQALFEKEEYAFLDSPESIWNAFKAGLIDVYNLAPDQLKQLDQFLASDIYKEQKKKGAGINRLSYLARVYTFVGWNLEKPWFQSKKVRKALTMSIDRNRLIDQVLNGLGVPAHGSFHPLSEANDPSIKPLPFDPDEAKKLLHEEEWVDRDGDGVREKVIEGKTVPFRFYLLFFARNPNSRRIAEFIATSLKEVGIRCELQGKDVADFSSAFEERQFDSLLLSWALGNPPENPRQLWHSEGAKQKGSSNMVGFVNKEADKIIEDLEYEGNPKKRVELFHAFDALLHDEQPYTFLYVPKVLFLYRDYVKHVYIPKEHPEIFQNPDVSEPLQELFTLDKK